MTAQHNSPAIEAAGRAVLYLRVSSDGQVNTDYDPEGISIPAQREVCTRKSAGLGMEVVDECIEPGRSGTTIAKRPQFQQMLQRIRGERDVSHVIVYKLSRMNRNRVEDALVVDQFRKLGVTLISATGAIDDSRNGQLLHGVLAAINEFRSAEDGADIRDKMGYKARNGGTIGKAPLGYRNVRIDYEGRQVNTVELDEQRAPLVRKAWELYGTGEYTIDRLQATVADLGLTTRRTAARPEQPVSASKLHQMLRDPYYAGWIEYKGELYPGRHEALISQELFDRVQDVLDARSAAGQRDRIHFHYLKGLLRCARCRDLGRESRLIYTKTKGRGGKHHEYYFCRARQDGLCDLSYLPLDIVEDAVEATYAGMQLSEAFVADMNTNIDAVLAEEQTATERLRAGIARQLKELDLQADRLLDFAADGTLPQDKIKARLRTITSSRRRLQDELAAADTQRAAGAERLRESLALARILGNFYAAADKPTRRMLVQTFHDALYLDERGRVNDSPIRPPYDELYAAERATSAVQPRPPRRNQA